MWRHQPPLIEEGNDVDEPLNDLARAALGPEEEWQVPEGLLVDPPRLRSAGTAVMGVTYQRRAEDASSAGCSEYLTKDEVARLLKLSTKTIERAILGGEIPAFKVRQRVRICRDDLDAWLDAQRVEPSIHDV